MISARINEINKRKMKEKLTRNWFLEKKEKKESEVTQPCLTLCSSMDCSPPDSSIHGIFQARVLEWVAIPFSRGSSQPRMEPRSPALQADSLPAQMVTYMLKHSGEYIKMLQRS